eukprot:Plantae.Rhodophyta-Palmaria_palmata.ctg23372.p1 GENE.Plantae.Rhodophyta-Palmaria_palmata.ctg23372~~Plantae.Rhodophyta-Palmaria_palmata.ctg23372.p1  ORF type:complete len:173 (+),score=24.69 Plantae.Rhodophyta-Palmaria_palmata.ctg23372:40-519(+)
MPDYGVKFERVWHEWVKYAHGIDWRKEFPDSFGNAPGSSVRKVKVLEHLLPLNIGCLYTRIEGKDKCGFLPAMARASKCNIEALGAQSFCERIISAGNIVMTEGNTLLSSDELDMLVVLRMNRDFMTWAKNKYPSLRCGAFRPSAIPEHENVDEDIATE